MSDARSPEKREVFETARVNEALDSPGESLDAATRAEMEPRFDHDFRNVRVHADATAADSARAVNALAYALGEHIVFRAGAYEPHTQAGKRLLAHELTHVVQQSDAQGARPRPLANAALTSSAPCDRAEQEASRGADAIMRGMDFAPSLRMAPGAIIQRADDGWEKTYYGPDPSVRSKQFKAFKEGLGELKATSASGGQGIPAAPEITFDVLKDIYPGLAKDVAADNAKEEKAKKYLEEKAKKYLKSLNQAFKMMKIDTVEAQANYLAHAFVESDQFRQFTETQGWMDVEGKGSQKWEDNPEKLILQGNYLKRTYEKKEGDTEDDRKRKWQVNPYEKFEFIGRGPVQVTGMYNYIQVLALLEKTEEYYKKEPGNKEEHAAEFVDLAHRAIPAIKADPRQAANPEFTFLVSVAHMKRLKADVNVAGPDKLPEIDKKTGKTREIKPWSGEDVKSRWVAGGLQTQKAQVEALATKSGAYDKIYGILLNEAEKKNPAAKEALEKRRKKQPDKQSQATLQRSTATEECAEPSDIPPLVHEALDSSGQPLDTGTRALFEPRFGHDFGGVRVHTDSKAAESARAVNALAYTVGRDVVFAAGQFAPHSHEGRKLIAHELTHVVQQRSGVQLPDGVGKAGDCYEQRAEAVASRVLSGEPVTDLDGTTSGISKMTHLPRPVLQREEAKKPDKATKGVKEAVIAAEVTSIIDVGLAKIDEKLVSGTKEVRLAIRNDAEFVRAWQDYADRKGTSGASMGGEMTGFVDDTLPQKIGFVRATAGIGTVIHEAMHQRASPDFRSKVGNNINEGTTELFTRVVIGYAGGKIERNVYEDQKRAMLRLQGITGLEALAHWYFRGDRSAVEKKLGSRLDQFMYWMDAKEVGGDAASRADSAINAL